jgi:mono/diheme cytochrome c family protein
MGNFQGWFAKASVALVAVSLLVAISGSIDPASRSNAQTPEHMSLRSGSGRSINDAQLVARGKYNVEDLAVCTQCHTPQTSTGDLDRSRWLEGAPLWLQPPNPEPNWPIRAPRIAGSPPGSDEDLISLLTTGKWRGGQRLRPPMPQFRMTAEDAQAVVAYLRSLSSAEEPGR